jgi:hypothetical protein
MVMICKCKCKYKYKYKIKNKKEIKIKKNQFLTKKIFIVKILFWDIILGQD